MSEKLTIALLNAQGLAAASLNTTMRQLWAGHDVIIIPPEDVRDDKLEHIDVLISPGITGEVSPYADMLGDAGFYNKEKFRNNGGITWDICAAAYNSSERIIYTDSKGGIKMRQPLYPLFNGAAIGPIITPALISDQQNRFADVEPVNIVIEGAQRMAAFVPYGNGPKFVGEANTYPKKLMDVFARYTDDVDMPPAVIGLKAGKGYGILQGPLLEYAPEDFVFNADYGHERERNRIAAMRSLFERYNPPRLQLLNTLRDKCLEIKAQSLEIA